jgi:hypothetical protein
MPVPMRVTHLMSLYVDATLACRLRKTSGCTPRYLILNFGLRQVKGGFFAYCHLG